MRIEELYEPQDSKVLPVRIQSPTNVTTSCRIIKKNEPPKTNRDIKPKATSASSGGDPNIRHRHRRSSAMRLEQVNRHEENSYLLDAETNQAILEHIVSKDELCRFLSPLRFLEIDTWRKEVPYGLAQESEEDKRKWRTPLEILNGREKTSEDDSFNHDSNNNPRTPRSRLSKRQNKSAMRRKFESTNLEKDDFKTIPQESSSPTYLKFRPKPGDENYEHSVDNLQNGEISMNRPATSPADRQGVPSKDKGEKMGTRQVSARFLGRRGESSPNLTNRSSGYSSNDRFPTSNTFQNRMKTSPLLSFRRMRNSGISGLARGQRLTSDFDYNGGAKPNRSVLVKDKLPNQPRSPVYRLAEEHRIQNSNENQHMSTSITRPRTRSGPLIGRVPETVENYNETKLSLYSPCPPVIEKRKLHTSYSDPNIAYVPESPRRNQSSMNLGAAGAVENIISYAQNLVFPARKSTETEEYSINAVASYSNMHGSMRGCRKTALRYNGTWNANMNSSHILSPRIVYSTSPREATRSSSYSINRHSPWVAQALPDLSLNEKAKAESDGYYASRKSNKTVTFRLGERKIDIAKDLTGGYGEDRISSKVLPMVVVNIDQVSTTPRTELSHSGTLNTPRNNAHLKHLTGRIY